MIRIFRDSCDDDRTSGTLFIIQQATYNTYRPQATAESNSGSKNLKEQKEVHKTDRERVLYCTK